MIRALLTDKVKDNIHMAEWIILTVLSETTGLFFSTLSN